MSDKSKLLADIESGFAELQDSVEGLPDERMTPAAFGEWSAKDVLMHAASWDEVAALDMERISRGHVPCLAAFQEGEVDNWNAFLMRPRRLFPLPQVRFESKYCHECLVGGLEALPESMFGPGMVSAFAQIIAGHYRDHARQVREWREREGL